MDIELPPVRASVSAAETMSMLLLFICVGLNYDWVLSLRLDLGVPISALDVLGCGIIVAAFGRLLFGRTPGPLPAVCSLSLFGMIAVIVIGVGIGLDNGARVYDVAQDLRVVLYLVVAFWIFTNFPPTVYADKLRGIFLWAGFAVALQVLATLIIEYRRIGEFEHARNVAVPAQVLPFALTYSLFMPPPGLLRKKWLRRLLIMVFVAAILLCLTRIVWLQTLLTFAILFASDHRRYRAALGVLIIIPLSLGTVLLLGKAWVPAKDLSDEVSRRVAAFGDLAQGQDLGTLYARVDEISEGLSSIERHPMLGTGLGSVLTHYNPADNIFEEGTFIQNSMVYYAVKFGLIGLAIVGIFYIVPLWQAYTISRRSVYFRSARILAAGTLAFLVAGNFSGNLNYPPFVILVACLLAGCVSLKRGAGSLQAKKLLAQAGPVLPGTR